MSTLMEDRLSAALRARADQVQPEDLRPLDHAVPVTPLRRRTPLLLGLAAAACAAAIAFPFVVGTDATTEPAPAPAPAQTVSRADVDGDGALDDVRVGYADGDARYKVVVDLASGDKVVTGGETGQQPDLFVGDDLDSNGTQEVLLRVSDDPSVLPHVYTWMDNEGLVRATFPDREVAGWVPGGEQNRWAVRQERLRTWELLGDEQDPLEQVALWTWDLRDGRFVLGALQTRCLPEGADVPVPCEEGALASPDASPRGDLPTLMPAVEETLRGQRYHYGRGPASGDYVQLQGALGEEGGAVRDGQVELVVTRPALGDEYRVPISAGQSPRLVPQVVVVAGDAPVFVVQRSGGDTAVLELFSFWNGNLIEVEPTGDVFLGSGFVDYQGEMTEQRTWVTPEGKMFTSVLLDFETRRHHLWRWHDDLDAETIAPTDLGEACIDWETGEYGLCS
jgi:hypothetical protein